jgi:hypothetical protein
MRSASAMALVKTAATVHVAAAPILPSCVMSHYGVVLCVVSRHLMHNYSW